MTAHDASREASRSVGQRVDRLCIACVRDTHVDGGAVALMASDGARDVLCASNAVAAELEHLQIELGEGPGVAAVSSYAPVLVAELDAAAGARRADTRWPFFAARAAELGVRALYAFPIRVSNVSIGTLTLHRLRPGALETADVGRTLTAVEQIGEEFLAASAIPGLEDLLAAQVHQAAGMTMVQLDVSIEEALARLRATAYAEGIALSDLARDVIDRRRTLRRGNDS